MAKARVIAFYLPQFYPVKENDEIWGKGFTEWTNVALAKPQFRGHYQPQIPSELGFYDLRIDDNRIAQAELAREYGIEGFCYWHYWFGNGRRILEMPFQRALETGRPDFPFCLAWANHSWTTSTWNDSRRVKQDITFIRQEYPGKEDYIKHFHTVLPAFFDQRYIRVDGKPLFLIFNPREMPRKELVSFLTTWQELAKENGLPGIHFVGRIENVARLTDPDARERLRGGYRKVYREYLSLGFDAIWSNNMRRAEILCKGYERFWMERALYHGLKIRMLNKYRYKDIIKRFYTPEDRLDYVYPMIVPRWDKTPRQGDRATIYAGSTPELFRRHVASALELLRNKTPEHSILFLQAWNEWGEGNYMEPDIKYGRGYLEALKKALDDYERREKV